MLLRSKKFAQNFSEQAKSFHTHRFDWEDIWFAREKCQKICKKKASCLFVFEDK